jgi:limonene-1,2-epoxide hydrolase
MALLKRKRSGLSDPMTVVTNFVNACNRHDAEGVSACLHPEFDSIQPMYPSRNFRGADQVRRNWQAIFDAEPGFRLTVLRSAAAGDTVWLELHGAGRDAEVAGVFVMGVQGDRIRWARIYSALVEDAPAMTDEGTSGSPAPLRQVPPLADDEWAAGGGATASAAPSPNRPHEEELIAPVVDIDGNGRSRRGRGRRRGGQDPDQSGETAPGPSGPTGGPAEPPPVTADPVLHEAAAALASAADSIDPEALVDPRPPDEPAGPTPTATSDPGLSPPDWDFESAEFDAPADTDVTAVVPAVGVEPAATGVDPAATGPEPAVPVEPAVAVETMVEVDPRVVVEPERPVEAEPEVFVEMSIPEGAVDPDPQTLVTVVVPDDAPEAMVPESTTQPGLIVTTPAPAADRLPDPPADDQPKRRKRKQR